MKYQLRISSEANKDLKKLDAYNRKILLKWLKKHIDNIENPRQYGKALKGRYKGLWRYRVGKYRIIVNIQDADCVILAINIGLRNSIYKR